MAGTPGWKDNWDKVKDGVLESIRVTWKFPRIHHQSTGRLDSVHEPLRNRIDLSFTQIRIENTYVRVVPCTTYQVVGTCKNNSSFFFIIITMKLRPQHSRTPAKSKRNHSYYFFGENIILVKKFHCSQTTGQRIKLGSMLKTATGQSDALRGN